MNYNFWSTVDNLETAKKFIMQPGYEQNGFFGPDFWLKKIDTDEFKTILDFGCGVGRNLKVLGRKRSKVYAYDTMNMIQMAKEYLTDAVHRRIEFIPAPITNLSGRNFDLVYASVTFQHIPEEELRAILSILRVCVNKELLVFGRGFLDEGRKNVWKIITDYFEPLTEIQGGDDRIHQLIRFKPNE